MKSIILLFFWVSTTAFGQELFDSKLLLENLKIFSSDEYAGRGTEEFGSLKAQAFIINQFKKYGVQKLDTSYRVRFNFAVPILKKQMSGVNVMGVVKGTLYPESYIVISAHHDHLGVKEDVIYNGADDNGSGTCALFAVAEYLQKNPPKHSVILVAFDGEEFGLWGSKAFVMKPPVPQSSILMNINMDMIGRNDKNELFICGTKHFPLFKPLLSPLLENSGLLVKFGHDKGGRQDWTFSSDHGSFYNAGIPFLYFGEEDHVDYHQPGDDFEKIQPEFYINAVNLILRSFLKIDQRFALKIV